MYVKNGIMNLQIPTPPPPQCTEVTNDTATNDQIFNAKINRYVKDDNMIVATIQALYNTVRLHSSGDYIVAFDVSVDLGIEYPIVRCSISCYFSALWWWRSRYL